MVGDYFFFPTEKMHIFTNNSVEELYSDINQPKMATV